MTSPDPFQALYRRENRRVFATLVRLLGDFDLAEDALQSAFLAAAEGATIDKDATLAHLKSKLADYKVPREIHVLEALPRNATGKILKTELRERLARNE